MKRVAKPTEGLDNEVQGDSRDKAEHGKRPGSSDPHKIHWGNEESANSDTAQNLGQPFHIRAQLNDRGQARRENPNV
jgi:hypothetical protein